MRETRAYTETRAIGLRYGSKVLLLGVSLNTCSVGVSWFDGCITLHLGIFEIAFMWGLDH